MGGTSGGTVHEPEELTEVERDEQLAEDPSTPGDVLDQIARKPVRHGWANDRGTHNIGFARERVAANPSTPPATLEWLSEVRGDAGILFGLLGNPSTPRHVLRRLAGELDSFYRSLIVQNPGAGDDLIRDIVDQEPAEAVTIRAAGAAGLPFHSVLVAALGNDTISDDTFDYIARKMGAPWTRIVDGMRSRRD